MVERSRDWLKQAKRDLEGAEHALRGGFHEWACFLSQQASEKAIKAVYQSLGAEALGHSVLSLMKKLPKKFKVTEEMVNMARELDRAYIPTRYPNAHPEGAPFEYYSENDAKRLINYAKTIIRFCEDILSGTH